MYNHVTALEGACLVDQDSDLELKSYMASINNNNINTCQASQHDNDADDIVVTSIIATAASGLHRTLSTASTEVYSDSDVSDGNYNQQYSDRHLHPSCADPYPYSQHGSQDKMLP